MPRICSGGHRCVTGAGDGCPPRVWVRVRVRVRVTHTHTHTHTQASRRGYTLVSHSLPIGEWRSFAGRLGIVFSSLVGWGGAGRTITACVATLRILVATLSLEIMASVNKKSSTVVMVMTTCDESTTTRQTLESDLGATRRLKRKSRSRETSSFAKTDVTILRLLLHVP